MNATKTLDVPQAKVVEMKGSRRLKQNVVMDYIMSMDREFTIHEIYAQFPGKESSIQGYLATLGSAGVLERQGEHGTGVYRPVREREARLLTEVTKLREQNLELQEGNYELSLMVERMIKELNLLRTVNSEVSHLRMQLKSSQERVADLEGHNKKVANLR